MKPVEFPRPHRKLPAEQQAAQRRAHRLEWLTLGSMTVVTTVMIFASGASQAMRAAWIEDAISMAPAAAWLIMARIAARPANHRFPFGFARAMDLAFVCAAVALFAFGSYLLVESAWSLLSGQRPTIEHFEWNGKLYWSGWLMIVVLVFSMIPPMLLARAKRKCAGPLEDKTLLADATMNEDDWLTALAAIIGVLGVGIGWWWADAAAACFIAINIVHDGVTHLYRAGCDLLDERPRGLHETEHALMDQINQTLRDADIGQVGVRLREEGRFISGIVFVGLPVDASRLIDLQHQLEALDWRIIEMLVTVSDSIDDRERPLAGR